MRVAFDITEAEAEILQKKIDTMPKSANVSQITSLFKFIKNVFCEGNGEIEIETKIKISKQ